MIPDHSKGALGWPWDAEGRRTALSVCLLSYSTVLGQKDRTGQEVESLKRQGLVGVGTEAVAMG